ncbi:MAG: preprotein translocase subunit SecY [Bacillota bacterium]
MLKKLWETIVTAFKLPDLRKKILFTLLMLGIYRLGVYVPVPGVDVTRIQKSFSGGSADILQLLNLFGGGAMKNFSIFFLGVNPYITASIIMQLLGIVWPYLERLSKEGVEGRRLISQYTRYATILLAVIQAVGFLTLFQQEITPNTLSNKVMIVTILVAGSMFLMWLGEKITELGIGNGVSLIIFAGIASQFGAIFTGFAVMKDVEPWKPVPIFLSWLAIIAGIVFIQQAERKIPVQYAKRVVGRKMYGGQTTHIPMRINQAGVIPIIFANAVVMFPAQMAGIFPQKIENWITTWFGYGAPLNILAEAILVFFFTFFYTAVSFNSAEVADNMKKYSGFIPGIRPGKPTAEYLERVLERITFVGALFLVALTTTPFLAWIFKLRTASYLLGGTGLLIVVGVALDTMKQIESHLLLRQYQGFLK